MCSCVYVCGRDSHQLLQSRAYEYNQYNHILNILPIMSIIICSIYSLYLIDESAMIVKQGKVKKLKHRISQITYAIGKVQGGMYWARDKSVWGYQHESMSAYVGLSALPSCPIRT